MVQSQMTRTPSFAKSLPSLSGQDNLREKAGSLRETFETQRCEYNAKQLADRDKSEAERRSEAAEKAAKRESFMVKRQQPKPVLRPSPGLAMGSDRASFNTQWDTEAEKANKDRQARKDAFKAARATQDAFNQEPTRARAPQSQTRG